MSITRPGGRALPVHPLLIKGFLTWLAYAGAGLVSLVLSNPTNIVIPLYLPAGIALACVLGWGRWMVIPVGLGAATVMLLASGLPSSPWPSWRVLLPMCLATCSGAALQAWLGARWSGVHPSSPLRLESPREIARFMLMAGVLACLINAAGVTTVQSIVTDMPFDDALTMAGSWWAGDALGVLIGAPVMLTLVGQPADLWRSRRRLVAIPMFVTTLLLGWTIVEVQRWEKEREDAVFARDTQAMSANVRARLNGYLYAIEALHGAAIASEAITRQEFRTLSEFWLSTLAGVQAIGWSERIPTADVPAFERAQRAEGMAGYRVFNAPNQPAPRDEVVAIRYVEPAGLNGAAFGYNVLSNPIARANFEAASTTDAAVASSGLKLVQEVGQQTGVVLYKAVHRGRPVTLDELRQTTTGVMFLTLRMDDMIKATTAGHPSYLHACMVDVTDGKALGGESGCPLTAPHGQFKPLHYQTVDLTFANRPWQLVVWSSERPPLLDNLAWSWLVTIGGVTLAAALGALLLVITGRTKRVEEAMAQARQKQAEAESANRAKSEFLSRMSHELRTPLNAVLGFAQVMELDQQTPLPVSQRNRLQQIQQAGWHLLEMIDDVLDLSRIDTGTIKLAPEEVAASEVIESAVQMVQEAAQKHLVKIMPRAPGPVGWGIHADRTRVRQILINLLGNAIKYNRPNGTITIHTAVDKDADGAAQFRISVIDTGLGMSEAQQAQLFQPFNRLGRERMSADGVGIGLVISQHLARMMKGELSFSSTEGEGSSFTLTLPASALLPLPADSTRANEHATNEATSETLTPRARKEVLYVEDNLANAELVRSALASRPWIKLTVAKTGSAGLAAVLDRTKGSKPDLILLDMHLPDISGLELLKQVKTTLASNAVPVIVISADAMPERIHAAMAAGATAYLTKPINIPELLNRLDDLLSN
ncbi:CHASE domain-containing protein [Aquabacterium sp.]|uniref:CHASE domain-containing protein n=1 Tax=Aquabacterium sp. TaxID=1872578 RepID=UPI0035AE4C7C